MTFVKEKLLVCNRLKPVTHEQVFFDKFWLGKFYLLVCKEEFVNFFLDKCTCSKASMIAFEQVHLARKKLSHCRTCSSVRVDKENLPRKNWRRGCFFVVRWVIVLLATVKTCQRKLVIRSHQQIKLVMEKLVKENLSFIHMSIWTLSMTLVKENLLVCNRL